jgi:hypothetical protein
MTQKKSMKHACQLGQKAGGARNNRSITRVILQVMVATVQLIGVGFVHSPTFPAPPRSV